MNPAPGAAGGSARPGATASVRIGVIGVGAMGSGMAARLVAQGFRTGVHDVDADRQRQMVALGAEGHPDPAALAAHADVLVVVVVDAGQIDTVFGGDAGLLRALKPGHSVLVCSTIAPEDTERFARRVADTGAALVDAPVSGGPARAHAGELSMMLAGDPVVLAALEPVLSTLATRRFLISARAGDAARAKLVNNLAAGIHLAAAAEALALARRMGLDMAQIAQLMSVSSGQSWIADDRVPRALVGDFEPRARTEVLAKDLRLALEAAQRNGVQLSIGAAARELFSAACDAGYGDADDAALLSFQLDRWQDA